VSRKTETDESWKLLRGRAGELALIQAYFFVACSVIPADLHGRFLRVKIQKERLRSPHEAQSEECT